ncbi:MAG: transposase [Fibrobacterota bacterium]
MASADRQEKVSDICGEIGIHANQFYKWQAELSSSASAVFERRTGPPEP